jgi:hypothetical protein
MIVRLVQFLLLLAVLGTIASGATPDSIPRDTAHSMVSEVSVAAKPYLIKVESSYGIFPGHRARLSIIKEAGSEPIRAFTFLIDYDSTRMQFISGSIGAALSDQGCQWGIFKCEQVPVDTNAGQRPSGLLRITAMADSVGEDASAPRYSIPDGGELARMEFMMGGSEDDGVVPVRFVWHDCSDNTLLVVGDQRPLVAARVLDWNCFEGLPNYCPELTGRSNSLRYSYGGPPSSCNRKGKAGSLRPGVTFHNGGADYDWRPRDLDAIGDINLNGVAQEVSDFNLIAKFLLEGLPAMSDSTRREFDFRADINADSLTLTIADMVYMQRVIVGDALPYSKLETYGDTVEVEFKEDTLTVTSPARLAGIHAIFECDRDYPVESLRDIPAKSYYDTTTHELRVLQTCFFERRDSTEYNSCLHLGLNAGKNRLFALRGPAKLKSIQISGYYGNLLRCYYGDQRSPLYVALEYSQNSSGLDTVHIDVYLSVKTDWRIDISNTRQQILETYTGKDIGHKLINWVWSGLLPDTYTVKAVAGSFTLTREVVKGWNSPPK